MRERVEMARERMGKQEVSENFYEQITPRLYRRIGRELRLARYVLDLGCGSCELVRYLADGYGQKVTGIDISSDSFPHRRSRTRQGFDCIRRDASKLGFAADGSVDAVVTVWALHEMEKPEAILAEACRVLRPGGEVLVVDFPRESLAQQLWDEDYYRPDEVKSLLREAGFMDVLVRLVESDQVIWARGYRSMVRTGRELEV
jgi:ubiquinone/menaquinone biosynthesis C-methylase UbiE